MKVAVLVSGTGTNLQALIDADRAGKLSPAEIALVVSNVAGVPALDRAGTASIPTRVVDHKAFGSREEFERALLQELEAAGVELVVLAGFMRVLTPTFLGAYPNRVINTHPALCPAFPGMHGARQALEYGVKVTGCTVHLVDAGVDTGPILMQAAVDVLPGDDEKTLQARIQAEEHRLLPEAVTLMASGAVQVEGRKVAIRK
jgi:phosphoribosylglycinamide formyltransferase-1